MRWEYSQKILLKVVMGIVRDMMKNEMAKSMDN